MATSGERSGSGSVGSAAAAANVLDGFQTFSVTAGGTTVLTVPAGRTWVGTVALTVYAANDGAAAVRAAAVGLVTVVGAGSAPPAGNVYQVGCLAGANVAGGTVGSQAANSGSVPLQVTAPAGNSVAIQVTPTIGGSQGAVNCTCVGALQ